MLTWLTRDSLTFPPLEKALHDPNGLLAAGGDLSPERLVQAYRHGCFPWYQDGQPILWWSPDPRTVLLPGQLHVSRSLAKLMRQGRYEVSFDTDFAAVIAACAAPRLLRTAPPWHRAFGGGTPGRRAGGRPVRPGHGPAVLR